MFELMNPQLVRMEEERRRRDILDTIQSSRRAEPARYRLGIWLRDVGERMAGEETHGQHNRDRRHDPRWATHG
jgi:hypothetical protein